MEAAKIIQEAYRDKCKEFHTRNIFGTILREKDAVNIIQRAVRNKQTVKVETALATPIYTVRTPSRTITPSPPPSAFVSLSLKK